MFTLFPPKKQKEQLAFIMQIPSPSSCLYNGALLMLAAWLWQRPGSNRKSLGPAVKHKSHLTADLLWDSVCVWVSDWAWGGSGWKFAHHSLKANSVQVLGPIVPQYVGSAVRAGCTPVLDLCHLWRRSRDGMRKTEKDTLKALKGCFVF